MWTKYRSGLRVWVRRHNWRMQMFENLNFYHGTDKFCLCGNVIHKKGLR